MIEHAIAARIHGRYVVEPAAAGSHGAPMLAGFHGYAESAETQLARLAAVPGAEKWTIVSIQGLNRFYQRRTGDVVASWMTRQDREHAISDNRDYVSAVISAEWTARPTSHGVVFAGFSQGVAMAFRAPSAVDKAILGVIAVGGDVPPEITGDALTKIGHVLLMRGARDPAYTREKFEQDQKRLDDAGAQVVAIEFDGGHEWSAPVIDAASRFLDERIAAAYVR